MNLNPVGECIKQFINDNIKCLRIRDGIAQVGDEDSLQHDDNVDIWADGYGDQSTDILVHARSVVALEPRHNWTLACYSFFPAFTYADTKAGRACLDEGLTCDKDGLMIKTKGNKV